MSAAVCDDHVGWLATLGPSELQRHSVAVVSCMTGSVACEAMARSDNCSSCSTHPVSHKQMSEGKDVKHRIL